MELVKGSGALAMDSKQRKEKFLQENYIRWNNEGMKLRERRLKHGMSLDRVGEMLGTSGTRVARLEKGLPVSLAKHLTTSYNLLFDHIELRKTLRSFFFDNGLNWRV